MGRDMGTTSASVARILGLWVLFVLGRLKYREDSPNVANRPRLAVEWVGATVSGTSRLADSPDNFFARTLAIIGRDRRMIQSPVGSQHTCCREGAVAGTHDSRCAG